MASPGVMPLYVAVWAGADGRMRAGLFSNLLVWCSLVSVKTTGGGLPAGPFGLLGATQMYCTELGCISHPYMHLCIKSHSCTDTNTNVHANTHFSIMKGTISIRTRRTPSNVPPTRYMQLTCARTHTHTHKHARTHTHTQPSRGPGGYLLPCRRRLCVDVSASENQDWGWPPRRPFGVAWGGRGAIVCVGAGGARYLVAVGPRQGMCAKCAAAAGLFGVCDCV